MKLPDPEPEKTIESVDDLKQLLLEMGMPHIDVWGIDLAKTMNELKLKLEKKDEQGKM